MTEKPHILIVDDDERLLNAAKRTLRKNFVLEVACGAREALDVLEADDSFAVVVSDQNMPDMKGICFLSEIEKRWPSVVRIMLTGNSDQDTAIAAINEGKIFRFLTKPCDQETLSSAILEAVGHHKMLVAEKQLIQQTLAGSIKALTDMLALSKPDVFQRASDIRRWAAKVADELNYSKTWELDLAAMFSLLGYITLPDHLIRKHMYGVELEENDARRVLEAPGTAFNFLKNIPKIEGVAEIVYYSRKGYDSTGFPYEDRWGDDLPLGARIIYSLLTLSDMTAPDHPTFEVAMRRLRKHESRHDRDILKIMERVLDDDEAFQQATHAVA
ncbi:MAG: HD domain-containing phosphohydrolase [Pseudomonadota bacterium]